MNLSGIVVVVPPDQVVPCVDRLNELAGVEVHHTEAASGRIVVVQEAETVAAEVEGLKRIKKLPNVIMAELVYHYFADDDQMVEEIPAELDDMSAVNVPEYLK